MDTAGSLAPAEEERNASAPIRRDALAGAAVSLLAGTVSLLVYSLTLAPDLTWAHFGGDGGELITAAVTLGVPHPPGYPLYILLGKLASLLPAGTVAWRFNLFSAFCAATAVCFTTASAEIVLGHHRYRHAVALATGLTIGFSAAIWSQAVIAEVYALNLAIVTILLWSLISQRPPFWSGLLLGLAITTHLTSLLLLPLSVMVAGRKQWRSFFLGLLCGLLPLLTLPFLAQSGSPVIWGDPTTPAGWWDLVSASIYRANLRLPELAALPSAAAALANSVLRQFAWAGWLLVVLGLTSQIVPRRLSLRLLLTAGAYIVYAFCYQTDDAFVYLLPVAVLAAPLLAAGLARAGAWSLVAPGLLLLLNLQAVTPRELDSPRTRASAIIQAAPDNAILLTPGDRSLFALWYFQHVEGMRQDLILVDKNLLAFDWYRARMAGHYPALTGLEADNAANFVVENNRLYPICDVPSDLLGKFVCRPPTVSE
ncbi:MAG: DUF2723 domain-containing protein [Candidatus Promineifilaceae bacterium]